MKLWRITLRSLKTGHRYLYTVEAETSNDAARAARAQYREELGQLGGAASVQSIDQIRNSNDS